MLEEFNKWWKEFSGCVRTLAVEDIEYGYERTICEEAWMSALKWIMYTPTENETDACDKIIKEIGGG